MCVILGGRFPEGNKLFDAACTMKAGFDRIASAKVGAQKRTTFFPALGVVCCGRAETRKWRRLFIGGDSSICIAARLPDSDIELAPFEQA